MMIVSLDSWRHWQIIPRIFIRAAITAAIECITPLYVVWWVVCDQTTVTAGWEGPSRGSVALLLALLLLLLRNASEEVIVCVKPLQDILFQLWQHENTPSGGFVFFTFLPLSLYKYVFVPLQWHLSTVGLIGKVQDWYCKLGDPETN